MARKELSGNFTVMSSRVQNQNPRGNQSSHRQPLAVVNAAPYVPRVMSSLLEGQAAAIKAISLAHSPNLPRTRGHLSQAQDHLQVKGREGSGTDASTEGVLSKNHQSSDE